MARLQETGDWSRRGLWRKLIGRRRRAFRPPAPMLGDDGKPLASLRAKANQHQREIMKEFGEKCTEFSEAEHPAQAQADKQAAPVELIGRRSGAGALPKTELEWEEALHTLAKPKSGRACGPDAIPAEVIAAGGQVHRRALGVCQGGQGGSPDSLETRRHGGCPSQTRTNHDEQHKRSVVLQLSRKDVCKRATSGSGTLAHHFCWDGSNGRCPRRRD